MPVLCKTNWYWMELQLIVSDGPPWPEVSTQSISGDPRIGTGLTQEWQELMDHHGVRP